MKNKFTTIDFIVSGYLPEDEILEGAFVGTFNQCKKKALENLDMYYKKEKEYLNNLTRENYDEIRYPN